MAIRVEAEGFTRFVENTRELPGEIRIYEQAFKRAAVRTVIAEAKSTAKGLTSQDGVYKLALKDLRSRGGLGVLTYGGQPYDMGAEFGSGTYRQFLPWRGKGDDAGYFLWPAIRKFRAGEMQIEYDRIVLSMLERKFVSK